MIHYPPVDPLWGSEIPATAQILKVAAPQAGLMIPTATVGPLWEARAEILEGDVWKALKSRRALKSQHHTGGTNDSNGYCWPSLGLGNTARSEILEGDVWRALKSVTDVVGR